MGCSAWDKEWPAARVLMNHVLKHRSPLDSRRMTHTITAAHDSWCSSWSSGCCDCKPHLSVKGIPLVAGG